ncbi:unnamed protein product [Calypogeia fissa]
MRVREGTARGQQGHPSVHPSGRVKRAVYSTVRSDRTHGHGRSSQNRTGQSVAEAEHEQHRARSAKAEEIRAKDASIHRATTKKAEVKVFLVVGGFRLRAVSAVYSKGTAGEGTEGKGRKKRKERKGGKRIREWEFQRGREREAGEGTDGRKTRDGSKSEWKSGAMNDEAQILCGRLAD